MQTLKTEANSNWKGNSILDANTRRCCLTPDWHACDSLLREAKINSKTQVTCSSGESFIRQNAHGSESTLLLTRCKRCERAPIPFFFKNEIFNLFVTVRRNQEKRNEGRRYLNNSTKTRNNSSDLMHRTLKIVRRQLSDNWNFRMRHKPLNFVALLSIYFVTPRATKQQLKCEKRSLVSFITYIWRPTVSSVDYIAKTATVISPTQR